MISYKDTILSTFLSNQNIFNQSVRSKSSKRSHDKLYTYAPLVDSQRKKNVCLCVVESTAAWKNDTLQVSGHFIYFYFAKM